MNKVIVAGCRDYKDRDHIYYILNYYKDFIGLLIHGGCRGVDTIAGEWAYYNSKTCMEIKADWDTHGKAAGPKRNLEMAQEGDALIAFWDRMSRGTLNMIQTMKKLDKQVIIIEIGK